MEVCEVLGMGCRGIWVLGELMKEVVEVVEKVWRGFCD